MPGPSSRTLMTQLGPLAHRLHCTVLWAGLYLMALWSTLAQGPRHQGAVAQTGC